MNRARHDKSHGSGVSGGFDFTAHVHSLCDDMTRRVEALGHINMARVTVSFTQARKNTAHGMFASLTPLRFTGGKPHRIRGGRKWGVQPIHDTKGREMLYIVNFYLPRFLDLSFDEKLTTVVHELWHISPQFNGDIRRFAGRCHAHSGSQARYDAHVRTLVRQWLALKPPEKLYAFLRYDFRELRTRHGRVFGQKIPAPKIVPLP